MEDILAHRIENALADRLRHAARTSANALIRSRVLGLIRHAPGFAGALRRMKLEALSANRTLADQAVQQMRENGMRVCLARDGREALNYLQSVMAGPGIVVKSKSSLETELNLPAALSELGLHIIETDLGIVPTLEDGVRVMRGAALFGAGQLLGNYVSCISGPADGIAGPAEVHVVLVDAGRSRAIGRGYGEALACINCGSCLNFCPVYAELGDAMGRRRAGGIGLLQTALLDGRAAADADGASLCIGCGKCQTVCPVQLDTPGLLARLRGESGLSPAPRVARLLRWAAARRSRLRKVGQLVHFYQWSGLQAAARLVGVELLDLEARQACCGGGTFPLAHPGVAERLRDTLLEDADGAGAGVLVTADPGCLLHLRAGGRPVLHVAEVLARAEAALKAAGWRFLRTRSPAVARDYLCDLLNPGEILDRHPSRAWDLIRPDQMLAQRGVQVYTYGTGAPASSGAPTGSGSRAAETAMRGPLLQASLGVTGATAVVAETGTVILAEDDGYGRLIANLPFTHVVLAPTYKLAERLEDGLAAARATPGRCWANPFPGTSPVSPAPAGPKTFRSRLCRACTAPAGCT